MEIVTMKLALTSLLLCYASISLAIDPPPDVAINWTGPVTNIVSKAINKNYNEMTEYTSWGVGRRNN